MQSKIRWKIGRIPLNSWIFIPELKSTLQQYRAASDGWLYVNDTGGGLCGSPRHTIDIFIGRGTRAERIAPIFYALQEVKVWGR